LNRVETDLAIRLARICGRMRHAALVTSVLGAREEMTMRTLALALLAAAVLSGPALAQHGPPPAAAKPAPARPAPGPVAPHAPYTLDTPIEVMMQDPVTLSWLDKHFPGLTERMKDEEVATLFAGVSIQGLSIDPDHGRALTPEVMAKLKVSLEQAQAPPPAT
jgi:hypothetical protein